MNGKEEVNVCKYCSRFYQSVNLFKHHPVLGESEDGRYPLVPLTKIPLKVNIKFWGKFMGFGCHPQSLIKYSQEKYEEIAKFRGEFSSLEERS